MTRSHTSIVTNMSANLYTNKPHQYKLCDIFQDSMVFNVVMYHISTEISTELMFAFIEFTQFRLLLESDDTFMRHVNEYIQQQQ